MKICIVGCYPPHRYGVALYTRDLVRALREASPNLKISIVAHADPGPGELDGARVFRILKRESPLYFVKLFRKIVQIKPNLVHVQHEYYAFGGTSNIGLPLLMLLLKAFSIPVVATMHEVFLMPQLSRRSRLKAFMRYLIFRFQTALIATLSDRVIVHTLLSKKVLEENFGVGGVVVVPHGTRSSVEKIDKEAAKEMLGLKNQNVIMAFGSLRPDKGLEYAIEAMVDLSRSFPQTVLFLAGRPAPGHENYINELMKLSTNLGIRDKVLFPNRYIPEDEVPIYFSAADIIVLPYLTTFKSGSGVLHLAAAYGRPVVSTDVGEAGEVLVEGNGGILVQSRDGKALASALKRLLTDKVLRYQLGERLREYSINRSSWSIAANRTLVIYKEAMEAGFSSSIKRLIMSLHAATIVGIRTFLQFGKIEL